MNNIPICISEESILFLNYLNAVHPSEVHIKADHWNFIFQLYSKDQQLHNGFFTDNYFLSLGKQFLILEEYDKSINKKGLIKVDNDVKLKLRIFDFDREVTGEFSSLTGGRFKINHMIGNKIFYQKQYLEKVVEFEIGLSDIKFNIF